MKHTLIKKIVLGASVIMIVCTFIQIQPKTAKAQWPVTITSDASITGISNSVNLWMQRIKEYVLDGLAWHIAKIMVQQITASTVQWINSGFSGSPSFLTNPEGYFANVGDQITGDFIARTGALSALCSPFNLDIRLALALNQAGYTKSGQYTCTLNSIISNVKNSSINGMSIDGFINGDFKQGGWQAFIAMGQAQNNETGVYLQAQSDLLQRIGVRQGTINQSLIQGSGFLSWDDCNNISTTDVANIQDDAVLTDTSALYGSGNQTVILNPGTATGGQQSIQKKVDNKGNVTYQQCESKTPGSVINAQLEKQLGSGVDQLNIAGSINQIVDALLAQLVSQILNGGLTGASSRPSGVTQSYVEQLSAETTNNSTYTGDTQNMSAVLSVYVNNAQQVVDLRKQAVDAFGTALTDLGTANACLQALTTSQSYNVQRNISEIQSDISQVASYTTQATSNQADYKSKLSSATDILAKNQNQLSAVSNIQNIGDLQQSNSVLQSIASSESPVNDSAVSAAQSDLSTAQSQAKQIDTQATYYLNQCRQIQ